ncbi:MAG TPA: ribosome silencing factor [Coriobacteriia bacterium]|nr:ribosome silencing factor [Coriobacteriia bacterium]
MLEPKELAVLAATAAAEKKATDIVVLDVGETLVITNFFVVATGGTARQVSAIIDEVEATLKAAGARVLGREGERGGTWVLLDYGDVVVHVFQPEEREFYRLEKLWSDVGRVEIPESVGALPQASKEAARAVGEMSESAHS